MKPIGAETVGCLRSFIIILIYVEERSQQYNVIHVKFFIFTDILI